MFAVVGNAIYCFIGNLTLSSSERCLKVGYDLTDLSSHRVARFLRHIYNANCRRNRYFVTRFAVNK